MSPYEETGTGADSCFSWIDPANSIAPGDPLESPDKVVPADIDDPEEAARWKKGAER